MRFYTIMSDMFVQAAHGRSRFLIKWQSIIPEARGGEIDGRSELTCRGQRAEAQRSAVIYSVNVTGVSWEVENIEREHHSATALSPARGERLVTR